VRRRALEIGLIAAIVAAAFWFRARDRLPDTPEATIDAFFDTAQRGDDAAYLRLVTGPLRTSLESDRAQLGSAAFRENLRRSVVGIKCTALSRSDDAPPGQVALDLELVFIDRNERQRILLVDTGRGFAITAIQAASTVKPPIPYGTPVFDEGAIPPAATNKPPLRPGEGLQK
jgi:hypothetical protein